MKEKNKSDSSDNNKRLMTTIQEITDWVNNAIRETDNDYIRKKFGGKTFTTKDLFFWGDYYRLKKEGMEILTCFFDHEVIKHNDYFKTHELMALRKLNSPFYIKGKKLIIFHNDHIVRSKIFGVEEWLQQLSSE